MRVRSKVTGHEYEWEMHEYNLMLERNGMRYHEIVKEEVNYDNDKNLFIFNQIPYNFKVLTPFF